MIVVRYADDTVVGFQHRSDAERFLDELRQRLQRFGLELHPQKTRIIEFGRHAERKRKAETSASRKPSPFSASRTSVERAGGGPSSSCGTPFVNGCGRSFGRSRRRYGG